MPLVPMKEVIYKAYRENYAIPGFNFQTYEDACGIVKGAAELNSPVVLMTASKCLDHLGIEMASQVMRIIASRYDIPVVAHLDHATTLDLVFQALKYGYTSVMYDGSLLPVEENIKNTKIVVEVARSFGATVEAEIGRVGKGEDGEDHSEILTTPEMAKHFLEETGVDALAVAVGTCHGMQKQAANLRYDLVESISKAVDVPLVLHGSSGVKDEDLKRLATTSSFSKVNIGTALKTVYTKRIREILAEEPNLKTQVPLTEKASEAVVEKVKEKIGYLGSAGKA